MATKQVGLGTLVKVDENDDGSGHTTMTIVMDATPPARSRVLVDQTALDDTLQTYAPGIESFSEFKFNQYWHPGDTVHQHVDTLFGAKTIVEWQVVYPFATPVTDEFEGFVSAMTPGTIQHNGIISREVTVQRTGAITRT